MRDEPDAADLLAIARRTLLEDVLPQVARAQRYNALMVAAAMGIVERELEGGEQTLDAERAALAALVGAAGATSLADLNRRFAADIRAGKYDRPGPDRDAVESLLRESVLARLGECNPRYLEDEA